MIDGSEVDLLLVVEMNDDGEKEDEFEVGTGIELPNEARFCLCLDASDDRRRLGIVIVRVLLLIPLLLIPLLLVGGL